MSSGDGLACPRMSDPKVSSARSMHLERGAPPRRRGSHDAVLTFDSGGGHARLEVLDLRTGARRWGSEGLPFADLRGYLRASPTLLLVYGTGGTPGAPERG